ncbi:MAG: hypothetical protein U1F54_02410 [Burkholderiales bacterium]
MVRRLAAGLVVLAWASTAPAETFPPDDARWELEGGARVATYLGRPAQMLDGGAASIKSFEMRDGVIEFDVATPARRGFFGVQFRIAADDASSEFVYLRQHKSGQPDAVQYTPVLNTGLNWQLYSGDGFTAAVDIPSEAWFHVRIEVKGAQAALFVGDMATPVLRMSDLKSGIEKGRVALTVLTGATYFSNVVIDRTPDVPWERRPPPMPAGTIVNWSLSESFDALARDPERAPTAAQMKAMSWQAVAAEAPGIVPINRYRESPHPRVTFANDFSRRLEPQRGARVVYARAIVDASRDQVKKLAIGYSDEVSVFLNGRILFRGRSAQYFRDPAFLGIVSAENDAVYLPLRKGRNEIVLAVTELGGGWGFVCRLEEPGSGR